MKKTSFYSKDYFKKRNALPLHFAKTLKLLFKELKVKKILDIGCGTGKLVKFLNQAGFEAIGCDSSPQAIKISEQVRAEASNLPFKAGSFDCLTAISLIEHLSQNEVEKFIQEARKVLKNKGYIFLVTPNWFSPMRLLVGKRWFGYLDPSHFKFYSPFSLKQILKKHQFSNFRFKFKVDGKTPADWPLPLLHLPQFLQFLINYLLISSPLAYFRDSFWLLAQK